jgi:hypothetical protein
MHKSIQDILDLPSNQIDRSVKPLPQGWYVATVDGQPEEGESSEKKTPFYSFPMRLKGAFKDVDEDDLDEYLTGLDGSTKKLSETVIENTMWMTSKSIPRLAQFLDHLEGLKPDDVQENTATLARRIAESVGRSCLIHVRHEPWRSGGGVSARIDQTMIYED